MPPDSIHAVMLACHPETPSKAVRGITARICRMPGDRLAITYVIEGDLDRVRVPAPRAPRIADRLWQHTCCEFFIGCKGTRAYHEFNLSPSGEWAVYAFDSYRVPQTPSSAALPAPQLAIRTTSGTLELDAVIPLNGLSAIRPGPQLALAVAAVIEDADSALSYWALRHPPGKPDFHHAEAFALELKA
jgi:hypothetical protein